ncbi:zinc finger, C3HC4 type [Necator americanus]|uniref:Zinc finger, C3HC4 type n=1 Tax=Necator americanus TaxID=51031 RepID=W2TGN0_NECAM|nr:zinc finger, C3HC4 type [Necator americanus]ETN80187.1 zinc finger, C3HC4 type [Necator americanus]
MYVFRAVGTDSLSHGLFIPSAPPGFGVNRLRITSVGQLPAKPSVFRLVYKWFLFLHKLSYVLGVAGYIIMIFTLMGLNFIFGLQSTTCMDAGILLLFYGLYYGVLGRDFAHICTDRMACKIGYYTHDGLPKKHLDDGVCAVCDSRLVGSISDTEEEDVEEEKTYRLSCGHTFHEFCIRGWVVVGKLQTCPYCKEKVDLKRMFKNPQYGLILKKKEDKPIVRRVTNVFGDDDDEAEKVDVSNQIQSASTLCVKKHAERLQEMAIAEDPTIFDYDASYDQIQAIRDEKVAEKKKADKERKSKYALDIIKAHKRRELEQQSREERQQQKERVEEGDQFADKEVFVTGAYRKQMEEVQKFREEEAYEKRFNELTSVEHQKAWQAGFGRTLLNELARGEPSLMQKGELHGGSGDSSAVTKKKMRNIRQSFVTSHDYIRRKSGSSSDDEEEAVSTGTKPITVKKSIYSDDEDDGQAQFEPPKKNFPGELKPGLNRVVKAPTKTERLRERQFTPTPPSSDNEEKDRRKRDRGRDRNREDRRSSPDRRRKSIDGKESKESLKKRIEPNKDDKTQRLIRLKEILKQRNGEAEIEEFRRRYLERREKGVVVPPL